MSLIEILIMVAIMGILVGAILARFVSCATDAKDATLAQNLRAMRVQIELFRLQHDGRYPGVRGLDPKLHLTRQSNAVGDISPEVNHPLYKLGPYISAQGMVNPFNSGTEFKISTNPAGETPDQSLKKVGRPIGWFFDPATGKVAANAEGATSTGVARTSL